MNSIKFSVGQFLGHLLPTGFCEKLVFHSLLQHEFSSLKTIDVCESREALWAAIVNRIGAERKILFLEFGVWRGYSIDHFSKAFTNEASRFYGFDSFKGLPEKWETNAAGTFSTHGNLPKTNDRRVSFVDGWFQNTVPIFLSNQQVDRQAQVVVHFDADLYSSTLFVLGELSRYIDRYHFIFDEFPGHESRALYNFMQSSGSTVAFLGRTESSTQVAGFLAGTRPYSPSRLCVRRLAQPPDADLSRAPNVGRNKLKCRTSCTGEGPT